MKTILLFGAGKSSASLIEYLLRESEANGWKFIVADASLEMILAKTKHSKYAESIEADIRDEKQRSKLVQRAHVVISMLPPEMHFLLAKDCVEYRKHLLTASYLDKQIRSLKDEISNRKLFFLCEMGLDPGIDHMSAMMLFSRIQSQGGNITSFKSHCGGLVAPESDNNPWHYKISWNPRNVVMAGKAGAMYKSSGEVVTENYSELFSAIRGVDIPGIGNLNYYPNRDSLAYIDLYHLHSAATFMRTTLRYPAFMHGWEEIIRLNFTDETPWFQSDDKTLSSFFKEHNKKFDNDSWFSDAGNSKTRFDFLGLNDNETKINKGFCSSADVLQFALELKLKLEQEDKDMVVMMHEIEYELKGKMHGLSSAMIVKGTDAIHTAMAKTVGLPLGITAKLILEDRITIKGLHIPVSPQIYVPVMEELAGNGIAFEEHEWEIS